MILIILAVVSINAIFGENGLITSAQKGKLEHEIGATRERLELVLADAYTEKHVNERYNQDDFLDEFIYDREPDAEADEYEISLNGHTFELDRSVPQLGDYIGEEGNLPPAIRKIEVTNKTLSEISVKVTSARAEGAIYKYSIKKLEEIDTAYVEKEDEGGYTFTYLGLTSPETYTIKVDLVINGEIKDTKTENVILGELEKGTIEFGTVTWQGAGTASTTVTTDTSYQIQYLILPEDTEDIPTTGWQTTSNGGTIANIPNKSNVYARLWDGTNASDYATLPVKDEIKPTINSFEAIETTSNSIKVQATATDNESGLASTNTYKFYLDDEETTKGTSTDGTFTYENLNGLTGYKLKVEVYDNAGNKEESTINVTTKEPTAYEILDISDNQKIYVEIPNIKKPGETILCNVLYNDETNGLQLISVDSLEDVTLGYGDPTVTGSDNFTKAMNSYNKAIETLNSKAKEYIDEENENYALIKDIVESARCVGSNPKNPSAQAGMHITQFSSTYSRKLRDTDENYSSDYTQMTTLGIAGISNSSYYWLASRYVNSRSNDSYFNVRDVSSSGGLYTSTLCIVFSSGSPYANSASAGFRPCFTLKSGIKITGGDGSSENPYVLGV